ncbi:LRR receptor-like serine/threonine-protein kinase FLS2 [Striga hermonthica]|uniref:LRR receptor-like serine/threonine-protein kinase FLS2 n=1 Tax=Striga hermonthica TaxID=68872 RepID=A0A9N7MW15_STRHE|nr:LRR receptor-like serine/threonine-protein kinase FLS2 [Striga hermonthica]
MAMLTTSFIFLTLFSTQSQAISNNPPPVKCIERERKALSEFRKSLTDESGRLSSWTGQECCSWAGISCSNKTGHVLSLNLHNPTPFDPDTFYNSKDGAYISYYTKSCLRGRLNPTILNLHKLQSLDLSHQGRSQKFWLLGSGQTPGSPIYRSAPAGGRRCRTTPATERSFATVSHNNFSGSLIPNFFGSLKNLRYLNLSTTRFEGESRLEILDVSDFWNNRLTSKSLRWVSGLSSLRQLDLSGVYLGRAAEWLGPLCELPSLTKLNLSNTLLSTIHSLSRRGDYYFPSLVSLNLQWNTIDSDSLPNWLFNLIGLVELRLDGNGFRGPIPQEFGRLSSLTALGLSRNFFNGSLTDSLFGLSNLIYLDVSQNQLEGTILDGITTNLCNLKYLDLSANDFRGRIPGFGADQNGGEGCFEDLQNLRASHNSLTGPIPASFGSRNTILSKGVGY